MHNRAMHDTLSAFVAEAAHQLSEEVAGGAEVSFELAEQRGAFSALYCYRPMSDAFIAERSGMLGRLPSFAGASRALADLPNLAGYLHARGVAVDRRSPGEGAVTAFLCAVWAEATDFTLDAERFEAAYEELERVGYAGCSLSVVVAPVEGLVLESDRVPLGGGLSLVRGGGVTDLPSDLRADPFATLAVLELHADAGQAPSLEVAGRRLRRLQSALRLWDPSEPGVGPLAWARTDGGPWLMVPLAAGARRADEDCLLAAEEEDSLRAFCSLVARRSPRSGELAWALRRFELGCERMLALDALTDWLMAARALLGDPADDSRAWERLAAICAPPAQRAALAARLRDAAGLERRLISGVVLPDPGLDALALELADNLRAVLRDVLCGHLDPQLRRIADELLDQEHSAAAV
jgi:hypothetical protein